MESLPERLPYDHGKFVNRANEIWLVIDKARELASSHPVEKRVVIFYGARGSGKSWLLQEIHYLLKAEHPSIPCVYLDLSTYGSRPSDEAVRAIIGQILQTLAGPSTESSLSNAMLDQWSALLVNGVNRPALMVLLFDHVDESHRDLLTLLEDRCLSPLAVLPNTLIVLAGRGREYVWRGPELRLRSEERDLPYFDLPCTQEQLDKQVPHPIPSADEIQILSGGYPWSNYLLGKHRDDKATALQQCVTILLGDLLGSEVDYAHLQALCVLRAFSDEMIPPMLAAYFDEPDYLKWQYRRYRQVRQALIRTTLVKWDEPCGGYVIDEALRRVLEHQLYERDPEIWERSHTAARDLFDAWQKEYPRTAVRWEKEMAYHAGRLTHGSLWMPQQEEGDD